MVYGFSLCYLALLYFDKLPCNLVHFEACFHDNLFLDIFTIFEVLWPNKQCFNYCILILCFTFHCIQDLFPLQPVSRHASASITSLEACWRYNRINNCLAHSSCQDLLASKCNFICSLQRKRKRKRQLSEEVCSTFSSRI